jgi:hypothetical protein
MAIPTNIADGIGGVRKRFGFTLPDDYLRLWALGLLNRHNSAWIEVSRHTWLSPDEIATIKWWPDYKIKSLVPCAQTGGGGHVCWVASRGRPKFIADCPRDSDFAKGFAANFEGLLFRSLLDEFSDTWLVEDDLAAASRKFRRDADLAASVLPNDWGVLLKKLARRRPSINKESGNPHVISFVEVAEIVKKELAFPNLDEPFVQHLSN